MIRKSMIALATIASLGAASLAPAAAAGWGQTSAGAASQAGVVQVHDVRGHRSHHDRDRYGRGGRMLRHNHATARQLCTVQKVRVVEDTRHGKVIRMIPKKSCRTVGPRWH